MTEKSILCLECNKPVANSHNVLARHLRTIHSIDWDNYVVKHEHHGEWPVCVCGCNQKLIWRKGGFGKYLKGHDAKSFVVKQVQLQPGWVANPFTGREENITKEDEVLFLEHCISVNDPVTHDHGLKVPWQDSNGKLKLDTPSFRHLKNKLILVVENNFDSDYYRRLTGYKDWCQVNKFALLVVKKTNTGFDVVSGLKV